MSSYVDLQEHLLNLEKKGLLIRVTKEINKNTELHPLVRWQFRGGITEPNRKAFLFENVVDSQGKKFAIPVAVAALAGNPEIYATGLKCLPEEVPAKWLKAMANRIKPVLVESGPVQEVIHTGKELLEEDGGFDQFPVPISTPGFDNAPYTTCSHWITKDPDTGIPNLGNYRGHIKARNKIGMYPNAGQNQDIIVHLQKCRERGIPLQAALVVGAPPVVSYAAVQKFPYGIDEMEVAGGLAGEAIRVVKCKTVDIEVPADAEIVIEGLIRTDVLEPEGPFGESHGYMHPREMNPFMEVTCITHKKSPIWVSFISQVTPSESSVIKKVGYEPLFTEHLNKHLGIKSVVRVSMHEPLTNLRKVIIVQMRKPKEAEVWRALYGATSYRQESGKIVIAVDEDIDPENMDSVMWALSYRMKPHQDVEIVRSKVVGHGPPFTAHGEKDGVIVEAGTANDSALLINAIIKEPLPPVSLPAREYMERAGQIWRELGLPELKPQVPWFGYSLGQWDSELEEEARLAVQGEHYVTGDKLAGYQVKV